VIAYLDSSVVLRIILGQDPRLAEWEDIERGVVSALVEVECLRTLDRLRVASAAPGGEIAARREAVFRLLAETEVVDTSAAILRRASEPFPVPIGTLDALHLATALLWRDVFRRELVFATHDRVLGTAARASGLPTVGAD
jgi:predicted nucleic acid-binding protein